MMAAARMGCAVEELRLALLAAALPRCAAVYRVARRRVPMRFDTFPSTADEVETVDVRCCRPSILCTTEHQALLPDGSRLSWPSGGRW